MEIRKRKREQKDTSKPDVDCDSLPFSYGGDHTMACVLGVGFLFRLLCFVLFAEWLGSRAELVSPLVSIERLQHGIALHADRVSPFDGDSFHMQPLILRVFSLVPLSVFRQFVFAVFAAIDLFTAFLISNVVDDWASNSVTNAENSGTSKSYGLLALKLYALNPISIASCSILSLSVTNNVLLTIFVYLMSKRSCYASVVVLGVLVHTSLYPVVLIFSVFLRFPCWFQRGCSVMLLATTFVVMIGINWALNSFDTNFIDRTYGFILRVDELTPNAGLFWYFFTQVFDHFRSFYLYVFQINLLVYVIPLVLTLRKDVYLHMVVSMILIAVLSTYPTLNDASVYIAILPVLARYKEYLRFPLFIGGTMVTCVVLMPIMWRMWVEDGSGNANFYFAVTMIYNLAQIYLVTDLMHAYIRCETAMVAGDMFKKETKELYF